MFNVCSFAEENMFHLDRFLFVLLYLGSIKLEFVSHNLTGIRIFSSLTYLSFIVFKDKVSKPVQILSRDFKQGVRSRPLDSCKYAKNRTYNRNRLFRYNASSLPG